MDAHGAAELAARTSYGRLVAYLAASWRDVAAAEDALGDALLAALEAWPRVGVPDNPDAWLLTAARRQLIDAARHAKVEASAVPSVEFVVAQARREAVTDAVFPDERLKLLFVCAHPAIDEAARTPLMLQTVLGLDAARIASAFLVAPATMSQRLVRVKAKIRDAGIRFEVPDSQELPSRIDAVLEGIYAAFGSGWEDVAGADSRRRGLADEAIWLGRLVARLLSDAPEAHGLLALMLHCEARRPARRDATGKYVPLSQQDVRRWSRPMIEEAEEILTAASRAGKPGRFQLEAAIQSAHARRAVTGRTDWEAIALLYEGLLLCAATIGARVGHAAALAQARGAEAGLAAIDAIPHDSVTTYQPYWALRAHLLKSLGRAEEAGQAFARAIGLSEDGAVREFLAGQSRPAEAPRRATSRRRPSADPSRGRRDRS
ncbi:MAG: RNA polymerase subunit sigma-70 [Candidatus Rokubacteria bacterium 13_1_40CM_2_68_8]|nr:MAG: RNA polymerase subunit sigma-70 [Candidatus Rokubacteria bacterium 13_1_40CM_2_68_8]